ncbi:cyclopropane-fatty-acyl-phospholipid synthase family protein [Cellulomonas sp. C5510]|uniref:SAM-dependent methyltransferase n=1 Tax=Cellulomonas sp. C5510 TaxID=2871170 RepID=UPI00210703D0|nr:class I SAM-dependent methyltransferase [Cellulomonas sp. C5510]
MPTDLAAATARPEPFAPGDGPFWDDPYIATQLLAAHLDPSHDAASRRPAELDRTVAHLTALGLARPGARVLDLGCGPGLIAQRLAALGCRVTGVDLSAGSLAHARRAADAAGLEIEYRQQDFRTLDEPGRFDLVLQAYGELSTFPDDVRDDVLGRARAALAPGGALVLDVSTPAQAGTGPQDEWAVADGGLWRPGRHLVLARTHRYPGDVRCRQYTVATGADDVTTYRMWFRDYVPQTLTPVLAGAGLRVDAHWASLSGDPWHADAEWLAVLARPAG